MKTKLKMTKLKIENELTPVSSIFNFQFSIPVEVAS